MIIESLLDNDLYSFTVQNLVLHQFSDTHVKYEFKCRNNINLSSYVEQINTEIDQLCQLKFKPDELDYLRTIYYLKKDYVDYLEDFTLKRRYIKVFVKDNQLAIEIEGPWRVTVLFEVPVLAIVQEVYTRNLPEDVREKALKEGVLNFNLKMDYLLEQVKEKNLKIKFSDFGTRRRYSKSWHFNLVSLLASTYNKHPENIGRIYKYRDIFVGSSNVFLSEMHGIAPIGTMSHQLICAAMGLPNVRLVDCQKFMLEAWIKEYRGDLGTALSDTLSLDVFLRDFDRFFCLLYSGIRIDSGNNFISGDKVIAHYKKMKIDPVSKTIVFSDGLDFKKVVQIAEYFKDKINVAFGVGTFLTNDCFIEPAQIVIKMTECNGNPVAKLSDSPGKTMCKDEEFIKYLKKVFKI